MQFDIITIFPEAFTSYFVTSILKRAQEKGRVKIVVHNLRDYTTDKHKTVDDKPYGGGAGMVLKVAPLYKAVTTLKSKVYKVSAKGGSASGGKSRKLIHSTSSGSTVVLLAAGGKQFDQRMAEKFAKFDQIIFICGHYEGVDARVEKFVDEIVSVGPYVLTGGELPTMTIVDAVTRLIPGVLGNPESLKEESFSEIADFRLQISDLKNKKNHKSKIINLKFKEYPHYTRPEVFASKKNTHWAVPKILLSGDHKKIEEWRKKNVGK